MTNSNGSISELTSECVLLQEKNSRLKLEFEVLRKKQKESFDKSHSLEECNKRLELSVVEMERRMENHLNAIKTVEREKEQMVHEIANLEHEKKNILFQNDELKKHCHEIETAATEAVVKIKEKESQLCELNSALENVKNTMQLRQKGETREFNENVKLRKQVENLTKKITKVQKDIEVKKDENSKLSRNVLQIQQDHNDVAVECDSLLKQLSLAESDLEKSRNLVETFQIKMKKIEIEAVVCEALKIEMTELKEQHRLELENLTIGKKKMEELLLTQQKEMESIQAVQAEQQQVEKEELKFEMEQNNEIIQCNVEEMQDLRNENVRQREKIDNSKEEIEELKIRTEEYQNEIENIRITIDQKTNKIDELTLLINQDESSSNDQDLKDQVLLLEQFKYAMHQKEQAIEDLKTILADKNSMINEMFQSQEEIQQLEISKKMCESNLQAVLVKLEKKDKSLKETEEDLENSEHNVTSLSKEVAELNEKLDETQKQLCSVNDEDVNYREKLLRAEAKIQIQAEKHEANTQRFSEIIEKLQKQNAQLLLEQQNIKSEEIVVKSEDNRM